MRLLILGTGGMAAQHAKHFAAIDGVTLVGGVDVDPARLEKFNATHKIPNGFASLDAAIAWGEFDAVANVTPDSIHHPTSIAALQAGKHVFCEKPLATDATKAFEMVEVAEKSGLINMVNLTYRNVAQLQKAREIVLSGQIGAVKHVEASYLQSWLVSKAWGDWRTESQWLWRLSTRHGSNGVLGETLRVSRVGEPRARLPVRVIRVRVRHSQPAMDTAAHVHLAERHLVVEVAHASRRERTLGEQ